MYLIIVSMRRTRRITMRKRHALDSDRTLSLKVVWAGVLIAVLMLPGIASAAGKKNGHKLTLTLKNGSLVQGELLTVMEDRLILLNANSSTGEEIRIGEVDLIRVHKKANSGKGFGLGFLIGAASGALLGIMSGDDRGSGTFPIFQLSAVEKAGVGALGLGLVGCLAGGLIGSLLEDVIDLGTVPPPALDQVLIKLKSFARVS
jgi:hypothetical protein